MQKLREPFMQTKVRLLSDTLPGAPQWAEQTTLFLVNHSLGEPYIHEKKKKRTGEWYSSTVIQKKPADFLIIISATFTLSIWPVSFIKKYLSLSGFSNWLKRLVWNKLGKWIMSIKSVAWQMLCWLCKPTEIEPLESCVKKIRNNNNALGPP